MSNRTQKEMVLRHLENGNSLTAKQARNSFRIGNVYEVIRRLRQDGNAIYLNERNGKRFYRLGNPRKNVVSNAYAKQGAKLFQ